MKVSFILMIMALSSNAIAQELG